MNPQTLKQFKSKMTKKAIDCGLCENFGQSELRQLKEKYHYNPYGNDVERIIAKEIDFLDSWLTNLDDKEIEDYDKYPF